MNLNKRKVKMFESYIEKSLVEKFGYATNDAKTMISNYNLQNVLKQNSTAILFFDAEYWAGQITLSN